MTNHIFFTSAVEVWSLLEEQGNAVSQDLRYQQRVRWQEQRNKRQTRRRATTRLCERGLICCVSVLMGVIDN